MFFRNKYVICNKIIWKSQGCRWYFFGFAQLKNVSVDVHDLAVVQTYALGIPSSAQIA